MCQLFWSSPLPLTVCELCSSKQASGSLAFLPKPLYFHKSNPRGLYALLHPSKYEKYLCNVSLLRVAFCDYGYTSFVFGERVGFVSVMWQKLLTVVNSQRIDKSLSSLFWVFLPRKWIWITAGKSTYCAAHGLHQTIEENSRNLANR